MEKTLGGADLSMVSMAVKVPWVCIYPEQCMKNLNEHFGQPDIFFNKRKYIFGLCPWSLT